MHAAAEIFVAPLFDKCIPALDACTKRAAVNADDACEFFKSIGLFHNAGLNFSAAVSRPRITFYHSTVAKALMREAARKPRRFVENRPAGNGGVAVSDRIKAVDAVKTRVKIDIGFVGKVISVDVNPILDALRYKFIPVVTPLAMDFFHQPYNINADTAACEIAKALKARKLVFLSDVPGVLRDPKDEKSLISVIKTSEVDSLIAEKVLTGGMLPKIQSSVSAIKAGTREVHMVDGRIPHSLLLEIFTNSGVGTEIIEG